jgi:AraC-like DNA-binding protein
MQNYGIRRVFPLAGKDSDLLSNLFTRTPLQAMDGGHLKYISPWRHRKGECEASFYAITEGNCWVQVAASEKRQKLTRGNLIILLQGEKCILYNDSAWQKTSFVYGRFNSRDDDMTMLLEILPAQQFLPKTSKQLASWLQFAMQIIGHESSESEAGAKAIINYLLQIIFIQALREATDTPVLNTSNLQAGRHHPEIAKALQIINTRWHEPWSVATLARNCGMCRSAFAEKFAHIMGQSPMKYLLEKRLQKAGQMLSENCISLKEISAKVGYGSEAAFSNAFKRWSGVAPGKYRASCLHRMTTPFAKSQSVAARKSLSLVR